MSPLPPDDKKNEESNAAFKELTNSEGGVSDGGRRFKRKLSKWMV